MKKITYIILTIFITLIHINNVYADTACNQITVEQMAKIIYKEVGFTDCTQDPNDNFFARITTAGVILNNANKKSGSTWYDKIMNLTDNNYGHYSTYKNSSFDSVVVANKNELVYIAGLVLTGKYTLPKNITLQANHDIVSRNGVVWKIVPLKGNYEDLYFGHEPLGGTPNTTDAFGKSLSITSASDYYALANTFKKSDYSNYTSTNVCSLLSGDVTYNITYDLVGGSWTSNAQNPSSAKVNTNITISNPQKTITVTGDANGTGATIGSPLVLTQEFAGWTSSSNNGLGSSALYGSSSNNLTNWNGGATLNTVFKNLRNTQGNVKLVATWKNITKELPTVTKNGYTCTWNTKKDGSGTTYESKGRYTFVGISSSGFTIYAQCTEKKEQEPIKTYTIKYSAEGSNNIPSTQTKYALSSIALSSEIPTKNGYTFIEWNTKEDGTGVTYNPGEIYTKDSSITLYAIWSTNKGINSDENPQTGIALIIIFPLIAILSFIFIILYTKRMHENNSI